MSDAEPVVSLREITRDNYETFLKMTVTPEQRQLVAANAVSIADAHFYPQEAWFRGIFAGDTPVGFAMLHDDPAKAEYFLWRFMIDQNHQKKGYGSAALRLIIDHVRTRPNATQLLLSHVAAEGNPGPFYLGLGFEYTGETDPHGELIMRLTL